MTLSLAQTQVLSETAERQVGHHPNYTGGKVRAARILARSGLLTPLDPDTPAGEAHQFVLTPAGADAYDKLPARAKTSFAASGEYLTQYAQMRAQQASSGDSCCADRCDPAGRHAAITRLPDFIGHRIMVEDGRLAAITAVRVVPTPTSGAPAAYVTVDGRTASLHMTGGAWVYPPAVYAVCAATEFSTEHAFVDDPAVAASDEWETCGRRADHELHRTGELAGTGDVPTGEQRIVRQPRYDDYPVTEGDPDAETVIVADGAQIGGVYRAAGQPGGALPYDGAWVSWGVAGLSPGHPTRASAEDVQIRRHIDFPVTATVTVSTRVGERGWQPIDDEPRETRVRSTDDADLEAEAVILEQIHREARTEPVQVRVAVGDRSVTVLTPPRIMPAGTGKVDTGGREFQRRPRDPDGRLDDFTTETVIVDDDGHTVATVDRTDPGYAGGRWSSRGPAGWSPGHPTRAHAEDVQIAAYVSTALPATYLVEKDDLGDGELWEPVDKGDTRVDSASPIDLGVRAREIEATYRKARCTGVNYRVILCCEGRQVIAYSPPKSEPCGCEEHPLFTPFTVNAQGEPGQNNNLKISPEGPVTDPTLNDSPRVNEADPFTRDCDGVPLAAGNTVTVDLGAPHEPFTAIVHALDPFTLRSPDPVGPAYYRNIRPDQVTLIESSAVRPPTVHLYQDSARGEYLYLQLTGVAGDPPILSHDFWHPGGFVPDADGWLSGAWDPAGRRDQVVLPAGAAGVTKVASHTLGGVPVLLVGLADLSDAAREYVDPAPDGVDPDAWEASREGTADELRGILAAVQARLAWLEARGLAETIRELTGHETG